MFLTSTDKNAAGNIVSDIGQFLVDLFQQVTNIHKKQADIFTVKFLNVSNMFDDVAQCQCTLMAN